MKTILTTAFTLFVSALIAQNSTIEDDLLKQFGRITYWANYKGDSKVDKYDSLEKANAHFEKVLRTYIEQYPFTINLKFYELQKEGLAIASSRDGLLRIYSWDTYTGGTMHFYNNVCQYKFGNKVFSKIIKDTIFEGDPGKWFSEIHTLKTPVKTYYLGISHAFYSGRNAYQEVKVFCITNNSLNDTVKLIKTKTGIKNTLGFEFDLFSVVDRKERPLILINYNATTKTLRIPIVLENGKVTNRQIVYQFTGKYFERKN